MMASRESAVYRLAAVRPSESKLFADSTTQSAHYQLTERAKKKVVSSNPRNPYASPYITALLRRIDDHEAEIREEDNIASRAEVKWLRACSKYSWHPRTDPNARSYRRCVVCNARTKRADRKTCSTECKFKFLGWSPRITRSIE